MPPFETAHRNQRALLWTMAGPGEDGRNRRSATSTELWVRWNNRQTQMLDPQNQVISVDATVVVNQEVDVGSVMWEGGQEDLEAALTGTATGNTLVPTSLIFEVVARRVTKDIKGRNVRRTLGLKRWMNLMPASA